MMAPQHAQGGPPIGGPPPNTSQSNLNNIVSIIFHIDVSTCIVFVVFPELAAFNHMARVPRKNLWPRQYEKNIPSH